MFSRLNRFRRKKLAKGRRRKNSNQQKVSQGRFLKHETLEDRRVLALLGVSPLDLPIVAYNSGGTTTYDSSSNLLSVDATPQSIQNQTTPFGLFFSGDVDINIEVDETGTLVGGSALDDFILSGDVDTNGDFVVDASGTLLTGEVTAFGFEDGPTGGDDLYDFRFTVTGGALAGDFVGKDIGVTLTSETSDFAGDFNVDFSGGAKGNIGAIDLLPQALPDIKLEKLINGVQADDLGDAIPVNPGDTIYFTYLLENTGNTDILEADVEIVDDNGTPGDLGDDVSVSSGDLVLLAASDDGSDGILSPGEIWQYQYSTAADDLVTGVSDLVTDGTYQLGNHPDGTNAPPEYGLRLDGLTTGDAADVHTFSFDQADGADVQMVVDGDDITISGTVFGGLVENNAYIPGEAGLWQLDFTYDGAALAAGDDDLQIDAVLAGLNTGSITKLFGDLASYDLIDYSGSHSFSFALGDEADDNGHRGFSGISGWGWLNHAPAGHPKGLKHHKTASDWLFTAEKISEEFYKNTAVATAQGATDMDMSHYVNGDPDPVEGPKISYNSGGTVSYDSTTDIFSLDATPQSLSTPSVPFGLFFGGDVDINIVVDDTGALVSGIAGDDFVLVGDVDLDGDFVVDQSGILLTGEVIEFSSTDIGTTNDDLYEFRFTVTGGLLAPLYAGQDLLIETTSESSTFTGDFTVDFGGAAKGNICAVDPIVDLKASIGNYVFIDNDGNGLQNLGDQGINGITVNLLNDQNMVVASTVTDFDDAGNAGFYLFYNLNAGDYIVEFEVPEGVSFTTQDAGDDTRDSDADIGTGRTDTITVADGEHRRDIDAGVQAMVTTESMVYSVTDYVSKYQNKKAGKVKGLDMHYSEDLDELSVTIDFKEYRGRLTDAFTIVVTSGDWPAGTEATYAIFYFDADVYGRHGGPVLTAYAYNGEYDGQSYRDSDGNLRTKDAIQIASSLDNSVDWIKDLSVDTYRDYGRWHRTMSFTIVASAINDSVDLSGWEGAQFEDKTSFAIDTYDGVYTKYNKDGFLKVFCYCRHGWMDGCWVHTTCDIVEEEVPIDDFFEEFGWVVTDYVEGISDGDPPEDAEDTDSDLDWAGSVDAVLEGALSD